ncbi:MAG: glycosyltransferase [Hyphomicrobiales bacterium]
MAAIEVLAAIILVVALAVRIGSLVIAAAQPALARRRARRDGRPGVSVLVPVKIVDAAFEQALVSLVGQDYPDFEIVICGDAASEAAFAAARAIVGATPPVPVSFALATRSVGPNPKITNLAAGVAVASRELLLIKDSNIVMEPDGLSRLVEALAEGVGLVCAIPVAEAADGFASQIEQSVMNGHAAPLVLAGSALGLDIGYGKVMLVRRPDFDAIDGIRVMAPHFGDDHALAMALRSRGLRTAFTGAPVWQPLGRRRIADVADRQLRWMVIRRDQAFAAFLTEPLSTASFAVLAAVLAVPVIGIGGPALAGLVALVWIVTEMLFLAARGWGVPTATPAAIVAREALVLALWVRAWFARKVTWRGASFEVGGGEGA